MSAASRSLEAQVPGSQAPGSQAPGSRVQASWSFGATGTRWQLETPQPLDPGTQVRILDRVRTFEATWSRFDPDSLVSRMAAAQRGGTFTFPGEALALFGLYDRLHAATNGAVDPLVGRALERLGYDRTYALTPGDGAPDAACWARDVVREGTALSTRQPLGLDVGAAGKGLLLDLIAGLLREAGHTEFLLDGSGDLRHAGPGAVQVGLEHPFDPALVIGVAALQHGALCASGVGRRAWGEGLHHVLDARSAQPTREVVATWALAGDALLADGLATALFFTSPERLAARFDFTGVRLFRSGHAEVSPDFPGEVFTA